MKYTEGDRASVFTYILNFFVLNFTLCFVLKGLLYVPARRCDKFHIKLNFSGF